MPKKKQAERDSRKAKPSYQVQKITRIGLFWTDLGFTKLRAFFGNVIKGNSEVYDTPFAKGESMEDILNAWEKELSSVSDAWPSLIAFENDMRAKVGPLSVKKPLKERLPDVDHYYADILLSAAPISEEAIRAEMEEFRKARGVSLRSQKNTVELMKKSSSSGNPYWTKRREVIRETLPVLICTVNSLSSEVMADIGPNHKRWYFAAILGWRGQEGGPTDDDVKQRVVWMFPFAINIEELQAYQPLIEVVQKLNLIPAYVSMDNVDREITELFDTKSQDDLIVCTDFSKYDQHFNEEMQKVAHDMMQYLLANEKPSERWLNTVFPIKYLIPLIIDEDATSFTIATGKHGMASGSGGTNFDETLAHRALQHEVALKHGQKLNLHSMCLGDDGILTYPGIKVEDVVESYSSHGQECNLEKQYASSQDCVYLRRWHHKDYRVNGVCAGVYSSYRALGRMKYLERRMDPEMWTPEMVNLRYLSILENCKYHPKFHELIQFCMKRDKFRLGIDIPGFFTNIRQLAKDATDYMPEFLGYTKTLQGEGPDGIESWEVVKYLKSLK